MAATPVSVLIPVYNAAATLGEALDSIAAQTFGEYEVVAVDDGSGDESAEILRDRALKDSRIRAFTREHRGLISTLNEGLGRCRGELIARMDADDRMRPRRLELQAARMMERPDVSVLGSRVRIFADGAVPEGMRQYEAWLNGLLTHEQIARDIFVESPVAHPSAMMRREELLVVGGYRNPGWVEDYDLWLRYHLEGRHFGKVPEVLLDWRESPARITRRDPRCSVENFIRAKAHYLARGPLRGHDALFIWGAGKTGRRLAKHLERNGWKAEAHIDILEEKIGGMLRGVPVIGPEEWSLLWEEASSPFLLSAVASAAGRAMIREELARRGLREGVDFLCAA